MRRAGLNVNLRRLVKPVWRDLSQVFALLAFLPAAWSDAGRK
jgi:hypothetical protein